MYEHELLFILLDEHLYQEVIDNDETEDDTIPAEYLEVVLLDISHKELDSYDGHDECHYHTYSQQYPFFCSETESEFGKFEKAGSEHYRNSQEECEFCCYSS